MRPSLSTVRLAAPAKINLFLEVLGRRPDGYHELSTLFQEISLADELRVSVDPALADGQCRLACSDRSLPTGPDNLVVRAARAFAERQPGAGGYRVFLKKRIPVGAGLGGGSSDAAAMLKALWRLRTRKPPGAFPWRSFSALGRSLGADVPFFFRGGLARAGGVGDRLRPLSPPQKPERRDPPFWAVLLFPRVFVSTKWAYGRLPRRLTKPRSNHKLIKFLTRGLPVEAWGPLLFNRLEEAVLPGVPAVAEAKRALRRAGCAASLMSGSGSAVFGLTNTEREGRRVLGRLRSRAWDLWLVRPRGWGES